VDNSRQLPTRTPRAPPDHPIHHYLVHVRNAASRASSLTRQLLAFIRKQGPVSCTIDINAVVADLKEMINPLVGEDVELDIALEPHLDMVKVDPGQIEQVILNLLSNSRDAMPQGAQSGLKREI
jgi:two-component system, cell cycle sensor histidine kinase and response regulator CckA